MFSTVGVHQSTTWTNSGNTGRFKQPKICLPLFKKVQTNITRDILNLLLIND